MANLTKEQLEEYKQVEGRILFLMKHASQYTNAFFLAFVSVWAWIAVKTEPVDFLSFAMVLAFGLLLGIIILNVHSKAISRAQAYKIVFLERQSDELFFDSIRVQNRSKLYSRRSFYGILGSLCHLFSLFLLYFDPTGKLAKSDPESFIISLLALTPGLIYSLKMAMAWGEDSKQIEKFQTIKKSMRDGNKEVTDSP